MFAMIAMSFDSFLVGTFVGVAVLGFYDRAYRLAEWPNKLVTSVVTRTAFYTYARLQDDSVRLQKTVTLLTWLIAMITIPLALIIFVAAPDLVALLYGERWLPSAVFLRLLVVYALIRPMLDNAGSLFVSTGHPQRATVTTLVQAVALVVAATPLTLSFGALGTCIGVGIAFVVALVMAWQYVRQTVTLSLLETLVAPATAAVLAMIAYLLLVRSVDMNSLSLIVRIVAKTAVVALAFGIAVFTIQPKQLIERTRYILRLLRARGNDAPESIPR
jgi:O-antigen/teichoic acid export membrane protein